MQLSPTAVPVEHRNQHIRHAAQQLETTFFSQMLKSAGLGATQSSFGGGAGEEQFTSFLIDEHAKAITKNGGLGLSEKLFQALLRREQ